VVYPYDDYILARSAVSTTLPEDDLFAGVVGDDVEYRLGYCRGL
jgi:hypothetical protein